MAVCVDVHVDVRVDVRAVSDLHGLLPLAQSEETDDGVFALGSDAGVLVLGVVQQALQQRLDQAGLQGGRGRLLERPPQDALGHQPDVTGLVLKTLQGRGGREGGGYRQTTTIVHWHSKPA